VLSLVPRFRVVVIVLGIFSILVGLVNNSLGVIEFLIFLSLLELNIGDFDIFDRNSIINRS
jgi:hypothetical protein